MPIAILLACGVLFTIVWVVLLYDAAKTADTEGGEVYVYSVDADERD